MTKRFQPYIIPGSGMYIPTRKSTSTKLSSELGKVYVIPPHLMTPYLRLLMNLSQQQNGGFNADKTNLFLGALSNSLGVQGGILEYGVRSNFNSERTISQFNKLSNIEKSSRIMETYGKTGLVYMKGLTNLTKGLGVFQGGVIIADVYTNSQIKASNLLDIGVTVVSFVPGWGWIVGGTYYGADLIIRGITDQSIGQHLDSAVGGPLKEW